jgi:hypothetical protein
MTETASPSATARVLHTYADLLGRVRALTPNVCDFQRLPRRPRLQRQDYKEQDETFAAVQQLLAHGDLGFCRVEFQYQLQLHLTEGLWGAHVFNKYKDRKRPCDMLAAVRVDVWGWFASMHRHGPHLYYAGCYLQSLVDRMYSAAQAMGGFTALYCTCWLTLWATSLPDTLNFGHNAEIASSRMFERLLVKSPNANQPLVPGPATRPPPHVETDFFRRVYTWVLEPEESAQESAELLETIEDCFEFSLHYEEDGALY